MAEAGGSSVTAGWEESVSGGVEGSLIITHERRKGSLVDGEKLHWASFFFPPNSVPINTTDVHLCTKPQTHLALGAIESPHCVRISHS